MAEGASHPFLSGWKSLPRPPFTLAIGVPSTLNLHKCSHSGIFSFASRSFLSHHLNITFSATNHCIFLSPLHKTSREKPQSPFSSIWFTGERLFKFLYPFIFTRVNLPKDQKKRLFPDRKPPPAELDHRNKTPPSRSP